MRLKATFGNHPDQMSAQAESGSTRAGCPGLQKIKIIIFENLLFKWNFLHFCLCTFLLVLSQDTTEKSLVLSPLHHPIKYLIPTSLLFFRLNSPSTLSNFSCMYETCSKSLIVFCGPLLDAIS